MIRLLLAIVFLVWGHFWLKSWDYSEEGLFLLIAGGLLLADYVFARRVTA